VTRGEHEDEQRHRSGGGQIPTVHNGLSFLTIGGGAGDIVSFLVMGELRPGLPDGADR